MPGNITKTISRGLYLAIMLSFFVLPNIVLASGTCTGTPTVCADLTASGQSICETQLSCDWTIGSYQSCTFIGSDIDVDCQVLTESNCNLINANSGYCIWDTSTCENQDLNTCSNLGFIESECSTFTASSQCEPVYGSYTCTGTANACNTFETEVSCGDQLGCTWEADEVLSTSTNAIIVATANQIVFWNVWIGSIIIFILSIFLLLALYATFRR